MYIKGFLTNLEKYNNGELVGKWISFPIDEDELEEELEKTGSPEAFFFTDWDIDELPFDEKTFCEHPDIDNLNELAEELERLDKWELEKLEAIWEATGYPLEQCLTAMDGTNYWSGQSLKEVAEELFEELYPDLEENVYSYIDYEAFARDLSYDGYTETENGVVSIW